MKDLFNLTLIKKIIDISNIIMSNIIFKREKSNKSSMKFKTRSFLSKKNNWIKKSKIEKIISFKGFSKPGKLSP